MEFTVIFVGVLAINLAIFWVYYVRTKKVVQKVADLHGSVSLRLFARIEQRLAHKLLYRPIPTGGVAMWAIIATYTRQALLERTLRSLRKHEPDVKILVIDNGSEDDTPTFLAQACTDGLVDKVVLNKHEGVPHWQKAFNIHQAMALLSMEPLSHVIILDDDVEVSRPFIGHSLALLSRTDVHVSLVSLLTDDEQNANHPTLQELTMGGVRVRIKETFNGAFVMMPRETLEELGLPPIREGIDVLAVEDWYWSRQLQSRGLKVACLDYAVHIGKDQSMRVEKSHRT